MGCLCETGKEGHLSFQKTRCCFTLTKLLLTGGQDNGAEDSGDTDDELRR